ncbi:MAG: TonB-dependent receptor [Candidatus Delongbacteria bacterium]|nr:TonB-dependent receptor [Candidatus Delongbacteria bacterium]
MNSIEKKVRCLGFMILMLIVVQSGLSRAAGQSAVFKGIVTDQNGSVLPYANIMLLENKQGTTTNPAGKFEMKVEPGFYSVQISFIGFTTIKEKIQLMPGKELAKSYRLKDESIQIGGITVTAKDQFIPSDLQTKTTIGTDQIEHIQATSLSDIMSLLPGMSVSNPTLNTPEKAVIRSGSALGTQVILDGVPLSNSANMQVGIGYSNANSGYDLRAVPAENVQEAEVIRGIPSVRYGNLTDGALVVKTKIKVEPPRFKFKYNPHLYEMNLSGGKAISGWVFSANLNTATSERDIRIKDDGYTRIALQLNAKKETERLSFANFIYYTRSFDESKEKPTYVDRAAWYNRDYTLKYNQNASYRLDKALKLNWNLSASYTHQNSYEQSLIARDNTVLSDRTTEGVGEGVIVFGSYLGKRWIKGQAWMLYADLYLDHHFKTGRFLHTWLAGINWQDDFNTGQGVVFNPLYPLNVGVESSRPRSYDDLPAYNIVNLYAEDKITGRLWKPFSLQYGFRYECYRPYSFGLNDFIKSHNGSFFNPRVNLAYSLTEKTQVRLGYGKTSKAPPLGMITPGYRYFDIADTVAVRDPSDPSKNFSIVTTTIRSQDNNSLKGYTEDKLEVSLDQEIGAFGLTLTGYWDRTQDLFRTVDYPVILYKKSYPDWPDQSTAIVKDTIMLYEYYRTINDKSHTLKRGLEFSLQSKRIPVIQTVFRIDGAYMYYESFHGVPYINYYSYYVPALGMKVKALHESGDSYSHTLLMNYRFDIQARSLGIWITLHIQQNVLNISGDRGLEDIYPVGYFTPQGDTVYLSDEERKSDDFKILRESEPDSWELLEEDMPMCWLFNLNVSKSLWKGAEVSFYVNNLFNHRPFYLSKTSSPKSPSYTRRNPELFFGVEVSSFLNF